MNNSWVLLAIAFVVALSLGAANYNYGSAQQNQTLESSSDGPDVRADIRHQGARSQEFQMGDMGSPADQRLLNEINNLLKSSYSGYNFNIHIRDGVVTLKGSVKSNSDMIDIQNAILRINGVKSVNNQLSVSKFKK